MGFPRMRRGRRPRRARTKLVWDRAFTFTPMLAFGTPISQIIGDPTILPGSAPSFDQNRTLQRIRLNVFGAFVNDIAIGLPVSGVWVCGVYAAQGDSTVRNPTYTAVDDLETDWMDRWYMPFFSDTTLGTTAAGIVCRAHAERDIRVRRKLTNDEVIVFVAQIAPLIGAVVLDSGNFALDQSLLWTASPT